jgi:hypothetical protein
MIFWLRQGRTRPLLVIAALVIAPCLLKAASCSNGDGTVQVSCTKNSGCVLWIYGESSPVDRNTASKICAKIVTE